MWYYKSCLCVYFMLNYDFNSITSYNINIECNVPLDTYKDSFLSTGEQYSGKPGIDSCRIGTIILQHQFNI